MSGIKDKVVAITGASSGIGEATALLLAERGAKLAIGARRSDRLEALADRIAKAGGEAVSAPTDVKRRDDLSNLIKLACERFGKLDVLVNNAGVAPISLLDELRVDDWEEMIDINLKGVLYGIAAALPVFRRQGFGHFVNIISTAGIQITPTMAVYAATKNAVRTITEALRQEAGDKLRVTGISPGFVPTNLADSMTNPGVKAQIVERSERMGIPPAAIARAIAFAIEQPWRLFFRAPPLVMGLAVSQNSTNPDYGDGWIPINGAPGNDVQTVLTTLEQLGERCRGGTICLST